MQDLWTRLQRDLTLNWKKTAALGVLFLFGCCFWIPMLTRAAVPRRAAAAVSSVPTVPANPDTNPSAAESANLGSTNKDAFWSSLSQSLDSDPLFQPAEMSQTARDPFALDESQSPLPVLFAEDHATAVTVDKPIVSDDVAPTGLELRSTMIGRTRRVAIINGHLYQVGRELLANGHSFRLASIESHRVVLTSGDKNFELLLTRPKLADVLNQDRAVDLLAPRTP
ncbi:MAG: hypothetical protein AABP62_15725 [Planctomycetota bacterium]